jgi:predicted permease
MRPAEWWARLRTWRHRDELDAQVAAELEEHVRLLARDLEASGHSPAEALALARRQVGHTAHQREATREAWGFPAFDILLQDVRYAVRGLRRTPGFTLTAVVTLGLGIGANVAMFAVIDRLMFRPLPYTRDPGTVGEIYLQTTPQGRRQLLSVIPYTRYRDIAGATHSFAELAAVSEWRFAVGRGQATRIRKVAGVSGSMFHFFTAKPELGRFFGPADDELPLGAQVAVLGHAYWRSEFGGTDVIGRRIVVGSLEYAVIGVAPAGFVGAASGRAPDIFVPITTIPALHGAWARDRYYRDYSWDWVEVLARRKPGVTDDAIVADLSAAYSASRAKQRLINPQVYPDSIAHPIGFLASVHDAAGPDPGRETRVLLWVSGVAMLVLLIACANVANLLLARILRRRREIAVRLALGVSRSRLAFQFGTEALVLALCGAIVSLGVAQFGGAGIRAMLLPEGSAFTLVEDPRTLLMAIACAIVAALLTVAAPLGLAMGSNLASSLRAGARDGGGRSTALRGSLLAIQGALSVTLLVGAALFVRSLDHVLAIPLGFDVGSVIDVYPDFRGQEPDSAARAAINRRLLATAQAIPGVEAATRINSQLFSTNTASLRVAGIDSVEKLGRFSFQLASPDYFTVMRTRILRGRGFLPGDGEGAASVAVVSASMGRVLWPGRDPLGQCIQVTFGSETQVTTPRCVTVVGIAEDAARNGVMDEERYAYYLPVEQVDPAWGSTYELRVGPGKLGAAMERVRAAMQAAMPGDGFVVVTSVQERLDDQRRAWKLAATLSLALGGLAVLVAAVGLYGVTGYNVAQRMHELGVRIALGASRKRIVVLVLKGALGTTVVGVAIGLLISLVGSRWLQPLLYRQSARDLSIYLLVGAAMLVVAAAAAAVPAWRATRADPNRALRAD